MLVIALLALVLTGCAIVIEQEPEVVETPPGVDRADLPRADPVDLGTDTDRSPVGALGWALLTPDVPEAVLEIATAGDADLPDAAVTAIEDALTEHGGKQVEHQDGPALPQQDVYGTDDLMDFVTTERTISSDPERVAVFVMALPGRFEVEAATGVALTSTAFAVFPEAVADRLPPGAAVDVFVEAVAVHELGHLFGLVNLTGEGEFHEDPDRPGHSEDPDSVMHWAVQSAGAFELFTEGPPADFTEADLEEMDRIRDQRP